MRAPRRWQVHAQHLLQRLDKVHFLNEASNRLLSCNSVSSPFATHKSRPLMSFPSVVDFASDQQKICLNAFLHSKKKKTDSLHTLRGLCTFGKCLQIGYCYSVFFSNCTSGACVSCCAQAENTTKGRQGNKKAAFWQLTF